MSVTQSPSPSRSLFVSLPVSLPTISLELPSSSLFEGKKLCFEMIYTSTNYKEELILIVLEEKIGNYFTFPVYVSYI